jgi:hypothetical protein
VTEEHATEGGVKWGGILPTRKGLFPEEWGTPPPDPDARAGWVLHNIELGRQARAAGAEVRWLHTPRPEEAQLWLVAHVESPALAAARRAAVLAATRLGPGP